MKFGVGGLFYVEIFMALDYMYTLLITSLVAPTQEREQILQCTPTVL